MYWKLVELPNFIKIKFYDACTIVFRLSGKIVFIGFKENLVKNLVSMKHKQVESTWWKYTLDGEGLLFSISVEVFCHFPSLFIQVPTRYNFLPVASYDDRALLLSKSCAHAKNNKNIMITYVLYLCDSESIRWKWEYWRYHYVTTLRIENIFNNRSVVLLFGDKVAFSTRSDWSRPYKVGG